MRIAFIVAILCSLLLVSGCLKSVSGPNKYNKYASNITQYAIFNESMIEECKLGSCMCMGCKNRTAWFGFLKSFSGGYCHWITNCTRDRFRTLVNTSDTAYLDEGPRQFMIGQGYSFSDFADANGWCGNRLDMAVQWLVGTNTTPYPRPDPDRAVCLLDKGIMPVYVLYSNGKNINISQTRKIAEDLGGGGPSPTGVPGVKGPVGPVIVTTEIGFNISDIPNITKQIDAIDKGCGNVRDKNNPENSKIYCMVALAPKMGDTEAVRKVLVDYGMKDQVDLIAFGIDSHRTNLSENTEDFCNPGLVYQKAVEFARFSLYNYSKPTVIPYVLFDSSGYDSSGKCLWSESKMLDGYSSFFKLWVLTFQKSGVIGVAPYDYNTSGYALTNPLGCFDCALGKDKNRLQAWFAPCRSYKVLAQKFPAGDNMILFANESGGYCEHDLNPVGIFQMTYGSSLDAQTPDLLPPNNTYIRCDSCVSENISLPLDVWANNRYAKIWNAANNKTYCDNFSQVEFYSSKRNLDPMLVRAIIYAESKFVRCAAVAVSPTGKLDPGCYKVGYDFVKDPDGGVCRAEKYPLGADGYPTHRYCAIGLMQTRLPPYTYWPQQYQPDPTMGDGEFYKGSFEDEQLFFEAGEPGKQFIPEIIAECSPKYNPFNATHAICWGTLHLRKNLDTAIPIVQKNEKILEADKDPNVKKLLNYYVAIHFYRGYPVSRINGWIKNFSIQKKYDDAYFAAQADPTKDPMYQKAKVTEPECWGKKDFIKYVRGCIFYRHKATPYWNDEANFYGDYGSKVLAYYLNLRDNCVNAGCPSWRSLAVATCEKLPTSWPPGTGENCTLKKT